MNNKIKLVAINVLVFLVFLICLETFLYVSIRHRLVLHYPRFIQRIMLDITHEFRNIIQVMPHCAEYDKELWYTLKKSGNFVFEDMEYSTPYRTNSLGSRDDESSLLKPEIVVLGDSWAMGYGVQQDQSFAKLLEKRLGKKVLNAAISSYGTAREITMLKKVDTSNTRFVIIQYCLNDYPENEAFIANGFVYEPKTETFYYENIEKYEDIKRYSYPFKYSRYLFKTTRRAINAKLAAMAETEKDFALQMENEARAFAEILLKSGIDFKKTSLIVTEMNPFGSKRRFLAPLKSIVENDPRFLGKRVHILDITGHLVEDDFLFFDGHFNARGHAKSADLIEKVILNDKAD